MLGVNYIGPRQMPHDYLRGYRGCQRIRLFARRSGVVEAALIYDLPRRRRCGDRARIYLAGTT